MYKYVDRAKCSNCSIYKFETIGETVLWYILHFEICSNFKTLNVSFYCTTLISTFSILNVYNTLFVHTFGSVIVCVEHIVCTCVVYVLLMEVQSWFFYVFLKKYGNIYSVTQLYQYVSSFYDSLFFSIQSALIYVVHYVITLVFMYKFISMVCCYYCLQMYFTNWNILRHLTV